mgnify:FL=1
MFMTPPQILTTQQQKEPAKQEKINTTKHGFHMIKKLENIPMNVVISWLKFLMKSPSINRPFVSFVCLLSLFSYPIFLLAFVCVR